MSEMKSARSKLLRTIAMVAVVVPAALVAGCIYNGPQPAAPVPPPPSAYELPPAPAPGPIAGERG
jgi:hypothetical protein